MSYVTIKFDGCELTAEKVSLSSQKGQELKNKWAFSRWRPSLFDAYSNPSKEKRYAWEAVRTQCDIVKGEALCVTGNNTFRFSAAYVAHDAEGRDWLIYHTPYHVYAIDLTEEKR